MVLRLSNADKGWHRRFDDPIPLPGASLSRCRMPVPTSPSCPRQNTTPRNGAVDRLGRHRTTALQQTRQRGAHGVDVGFPEFTRSTFCTVSSGA